MKKFIGSLFKYKFYLIPLISIFIFFTLFGFFLDYIRLLEKSSLSIYTLIGAFGATITLFLLFSKDIHSQKQIKQTQEQIDLQKEAIIEQRFTDTIKSIEETEKIESKLTYLKILENLAQQNIKLRQRIIEYLGIYTENFRDIIDDLKFEAKNIPYNLDYANHFEKQFILGFKKVIIKLYDLEMSDFNIITYLKVNKTSWQLSEENFTKDEFIKGNYEIKDINLEESFIDEISEHVKHCDFKIKYLQNNLMTLNQNFLEYTREDFRFEYECLTLIHKIINFPTKKQYILDLQYIFVPFLRISNNIETNLTIYCHYSENLFGLDYFPKNKKNTILKGEFVGKYSRIGNVKSLYFNGGFTEHLHIINCKDLYNLKNKYSDCVFGELTFGLDDFVMKNREYQFIDCWFLNTKFYENKIRFEQVIKNKTFSKITFKDCRLQNIDFNNFVLEELNFENCELIDVKNLESVKIFSENEEKIKIMKENIRNLQKQDDSIKMPIFVNEK